MAKPLVFFDANTMILRLLGLTNEDTGAVINNATVQATLLRTDGVTQLTGQSWPLTLTAVGSNGDYKGVISAAVAYVAQTQIKAKVTVDAGAAGAAQFIEPVLIQVRESV